MTESFNHLAPPVNEKLGEIPLDRLWRLLLRQILEEGMCAGSIDIDLKIVTFNRMQGEKKICVITMPKTCANSIPSNLHQQ